MALKNFRRVTFSLPKATILKLEMTIPKNKRSKFVAELIERKCTSKKEELSFEQYCKYWDDLTANSSRKTNKTAVELVREDRQSH